MDFQKLVQELVSTYHTAPPGERVTMIYLFGIKYADEITQNRYSLVDLLKAAEVPVSYRIELKKAINLAAYVYVRPEYL